jgi:DNA-binding protein HU-beta
LPAVSLLASNDTREGSGMTKNELAEQVAERTGMSASQARGVVEATIDAISDELARGGEVALAGFGKFSVSQRAARLGRNPSTGATINIAASKAAKFSPASALKKRLNP